MTKTQRVQNEQQLVQRVLDDIRIAQPENVTIMSGHFPIGYYGEEIKDTKFWNEFTPYTFEIGCKIAQATEELGLPYKMAVIADDHNHFGGEFLSNSDIKKLKKHRQALYQNASGVNAQLPQPLNQIMDQYNIGLDNIIRQDHKKKGREDCLLISEKILIRDAQEQGLVAPSDCGKAYKGFMRNPSIINMKTDYLVGFVPSPCFENVCSDVLEQEPINATHGFFLFDRDYDSRSINDLYTEGQVVVRTDRIK